MPKQKQHKSKQRVQAKGEKSKLPKKLVSTSENSKLLTFRVILITLPFLILLLVEGLLRIGGYGPNLDIFITHENNPKYWITNPSVGRRYFFVKDVTPATSYDAILKSKPENGYRIFVLGGSTTAGFPYYHNGAFPRMLQTRLESVFPERTIEIMNLGMPAVNSYTLLDLTDELMAFEPDAFLIYGGHNEFYGALGVGSTEVFGKYRSFVNFYLKLQHSKIFYLIKDFVGWKKSLTASRGNNSTRNRTLMERMVGKKTIGYGNADYIKARNIFADNLDEIARIVANKNIPIILANLVSNIKTHEPFESVEASEAFKQDWDNYYRAGLNHVKEKDYEAALISFASAREIYEDSAILHYVIAKTQGLSGNLGLAKDSYYRAKDLDALRFRATEDFNTVIETVAEQNDNVKLLDMKSYFEAASPDSLIGSNLMLEHLHPNLQGYALMAKAFFEAMQDNGLIQPEWDSTKVQSDKAYWQQNSVSPMDVQVANARIDLLLAGWPFKESNPHTKIAIEPKNKVGELAAEVLADEKNWEIAHVELAEYYSSQKEFDNAVVEYKALIRGTPYNISPYLRLGIIYLEMKSFDDALGIFKRSLKIEDTAIANKWIGSIMVNKGEALTGIPYLEKSLKLNSADPETMFNLTVAFAMLSEFDNARNYCERLIKQYPNHPGAQELWKRLGAH